MAVTTFHPVPDGFPGLWAEREVPLLVLAFDMSEAPTSQDAAVEGISNARRE